MARRVLIVSYFFPPHPSVASLRVRGLARYLPDHGWEPTVLTATHPQAPAEEEFQVERAHDPGELSVLIKRRLGLSTEKSFQESLKVPQSWREQRRSRVGAVFQRVKGMLVYPDDMRPWGGNAIRVGRELVQRERFDALLSSAGPMTVNLVAHELQQTTGLPWLADFRDLWTLKQDYTFGELRRAVERRLELKTMATATRMVTISGPLAEAHGRLHKQRVEVIPNGFDPEECVAPGSVPLASRYRIVYAGTLYQGARDPIPFLEVLARLRKAGELAEAQVDFYGDAPEWLGRAVGELGLEDAVTLHGRRPRAEVLEREREAQLLLLLGWRDRSQRGVMTGKLFEYLAAGRPVLAWDSAAGDVVDTLLRETGAGWNCPDTAQLEATLRATYADYAREGHVQWAPDAEAIERYGHPHMARQFAAVLDQLVGDASS